MFQMLFDMDMLLILFNSVQAEVRRQILHRSESQIQIM